MEPGERMNNIVSCKRCQIDFDYSPGPGGGSRQLCNECRNIVDDEELETLKEETILQGNKYLVGSPKRKDVYDAVDIIVDRQFPDFVSDSDRFICAIEIGKFIGSNGFCGKEENIYDFLKYLGTTHAIACLNLWNKQQLLAISKRNVFDSSLNECIELLCKE
jgi:hypothetical protein